MYIYVRQLTSRKGIENELTTQWARHECAAVRCQKIAIQVILSWYSQMQDGVLLAIFQSVFICLCKNKPGIEICIRGSSMKSFIRLLVVDQGQARWRRYAMAPGGLPAISPHLALLLPLINHNLEAKAALLFPSELGFFYRWACGIHKGGVQPLCVGAAERNRARSEGKTC